MKSTSNIPPDRFRGPYNLPTDAFAAQWLVETQTVLKRYAATGSYCGVRPIKLSNRRLLWPDNTIEDLAKLQLGGES